MSKGWSGGSTRAWRHTRALVLARDHHRCRLGLDVCTTIATCVHHTVGRGVSEAMDDLVAACGPCNLKIGQPTDDPKPRTTTIW